MSDRLLYVIKDNVNQLPQRVDYVISHERHHMTMTRDQVTCTRYHEDALHDQHSLDYQPIGNHLLMMLHDDTIISQSDDAHA
jgi:hypothetical protein